MLKKFVDTLAKFPTRFRINNEQKEVVQDWEIVEEGTKDKAEYFNEIQKNGLYREKAIKTIEESKEIYDINILGIEEFGNFNANILIGFDTGNISEQPQLRLNKEKYNLVSKVGNLKIGDIKNGDIFLIELDFSLKTATLTNEPFVIKNDGYNLPLGTDVETVLEGIKIEENYGGKYGGNVQNPGTKEVGRFYNNSEDGKIYECLVETTDNFIDLIKFRDASHKAMLESVDIKNKIAIGYPDRSSVVAATTVGRIAIVELLFTGSATIPKDAIFAQLPFLPTSSYWVRFSGADEKDAGHLVVNPGDQMVRVGDRDLKLVPARASLVISF